MPVKLPAQQTGSPTRPATRRSDRLGIHPPLHGPGSLSRLIRHGGHRALCMASGQACPVLAAQWERRSPASYGEKPSDAVSAAISMRLTCGNVLERGFYQPARSVRIEVYTSRYPNEPSHRVHTLHPAATARPSHAEGSPTAQRRSRAGQRRQTECQPPPNHPCARRHGDNADLARAGP